MTTTMRFALLAAVTFAAPLGAQGNLSTQGFGYPTGQLTSRALAMGGGIGEVDAASTLNPAAIGRVVNRTVLFQIEPEYRSITSPSGTDHTTTARYPIISIAVPFGASLVTGVSASTLLDRTWSTTTRRFEPLGTETVETQFHESSDGAINDLRLAETWTNRSWLSVGLGVHAVTGRNVFKASQEFADSAFSLFANAGIISFTGSAVSAGVVLTATKQHLIGGFSYRKGGSLHATADDTLLAAAKVPDRFGASVAFSGIQGTILSVRASHDAWSSMTPLLVNPQAAANDSWDVGGGGEFTGPRLLGQPMFLRVGVRSRTLPFQASGNQVDEKTASIGSGFSFGGGRMSADVTAMRQWRDAGIPTMKERAWTLSFSLTARP